MEKEIEGTGSEGVGTLRASSGGPQQARRGALRLRGGGARCSAYSTEFDREHPARRGIKAPSPQHKAWSAEKDRRKGIASGVLAILDPVRKRALAYARGRDDRAIREREKHETFRTRLAS